MSRASLEKFGIVVALLAVGVLLDQWTKWYAYQRLANARLPEGHSIVLRVPASADGHTLREYLGREFAANSSETVRRIAERFVIGPDGQRLSPDAEVHEGELLEVVHRSVRVIPGLFAFEYAENRGAAFSLLAGSDSPYRMHLLIGFSLVALGVIFYLLRGIRRDQTAMMIALSLVATGAIGNLIDRIRLGYVVDFILLHYGDAFRWPNFNLADTFISFGVALMLFQVFFGDRPEDEPKVDDADDGEDRESGE